MCEKPYNIPSVAILVAISLMGAAGCEPFLQLAVDLSDGLDPNPQAENNVVGLSREIIGTGIRACGPDALSTQLIPACPMPTVCFTAACVHHDECYVTCGTQQEDCDTAFFWDMVYLCKANAPDESMSSCYSLAWVYYQAVHRFGDYYFTNSQAEVCNRDEQTLTARAAAIEQPVPTGSPFYDGDDDLMPDAWELSVMLNPEDPDDAMADYDGDGLVNLAEFLQGSDPYVPNGR